MNGDDILGAARQLSQMRPAKHGLLVYPRMLSFEYLGFVFRWLTQQFQPSPIQASALAHRAWQDHPSGVDGLPDVLAVHAPGDLLRPTGFVGGQCQPWMC